MNSDYNILLVDGECILCNNLVLWIIPRLKNKNLRVAALQDKALIKSLGIQISEDIDSIFYVESSGKQLIYSDAALRIGLDLKTPYPLISRILRVVPKFLRDPIYRWVAKNRYRIFGKKESCALPSAELKSLEIKSPSF